MNDKVSPTKLLNDHLEYHNKTLNPKIIDILNNHTRRITEIETKLNIILEHFNEAVKEVNNRDDHPDTASNESTNDSPSI